LRKDLSKTDVLGISTVKLSKVEGISSSGVQSASVRKYAVGDVIFKTSGIVAYAQADISSQSGSKLLAVSTTGAVSDAISSGTVVVKDFYSAPNGDVYIVFDRHVALTTGGPLCYFAVVDVSTGVPTCVNSTLSSINWGIRNSPVQFDASGAAYYVGMTLNERARFSGSVLLKTTNGVTTELFNENTLNEQASIYDFVVLSDGTVVLAGATGCPTGFPPFSQVCVPWLRRVSATGAIKNLTNAKVMSLWKFADGNVYAGFGSGMKRYLVGQDALEEKNWISGSRSVNSYFNFDAPDPLFLECAGANRIKNLNFCTYYGATVNRVFNVLRQKTFGVVGDSTGTGLGDQLWQFFPTVERTNVTSVKGIALAQQVITTLILSGTSETGSNILFLYDTSSKQKTVVMDSSNEIEIHSMSYSQKKNAIMFSGLRISDNKYVVGEVSLG